MLSCILCLFDCLFFQNASLSRAFRLFRALGLRHIVVIDENNKVGGMPVRTKLWFHLVCFLVVRRFLFMVLVLGGNNDCRKKPRK